jgi:hypothetical protein
MHEAIQALIVANGMINPWLAFLLGTIAGITITVGYFKWFYTPNLDGSVNRDAARKASIYAINSAICSLRDNMEIKDNEKRYKKIITDTFCLQIVAEIQPIIPYKFVRRRISRYALSAEYAAISGECQVAEKYLQKIISHIS